MKRMENKLFAEQAGRMVSRLQETETFRKLFLPLVVEAKEAANKSLMKNVPEYQTAEKHTSRLYDRLREELKESAPPRLCGLFDEFLEADDMTDTIWAEEMYLRGIQDAEALILLISKENVFDVTKLSSL